MFETEEIGHFLERAAFWALIKVGKITSNVVPPPEPLLSGFLSCFMNCMMCVTHAI
jgi:hypothetical protein